MPKYIELNMVVGERDQSGDQTGEEAATITTVTDTIPTVINVDEVRQFYPRKPDAMGNPRPGTRITFISGAGMACTEDYATVKGMILPPTLN